MSKKEVTIIGAGVGGLSLGIALSKLGIDCQIFETWPYERIEGSSFRISSSGAYAFKELGVLDEIQKNSYSTDYLKILNTDNVEFAHVNMFQNKNYENRSIFMQRSDLIEILTSKARSLGVPIHYKKQLDDFHQNEKGVTAYFKDGTSVESPLLIGADGLHSAVRKKLYSEHTLSYLNCWALYGILSTKDVPEDIQPLLEKTELFYLDKGMNILVSKSNPNNEWDINWQATGYQERRLPLHAFEQLSEEEIKENLITQFNIKGSLAQLIRRTKKIIPKQPHTIKGLTAWSKERVVLIGDAAHGMNPNTGYGSSVAMEDAVYLASLLSKNVYTDAFYFYENDRKDRVEAIQKSVEQFDMSKGMDLNGSLDIGLLSGSTFEPDYKVRLKQ